MTALAGRARSALVVALAAVVAAPLVAVAAATASPDTELWSRLWRTRLPTMLATTVGLTVVVAAGALLLGGGLAWLVALHRFPGRSVLQVALVLPLAVPAYVLGFVTVATFDRAGPVQRWLGDTVTLPQVRSMWAAALVLVLALYPYVYVLARAAFLSQPAGALEAARALGCRRFAAARRVVLPLARPALAAGAALVVMETLTDVGTVRVFNQQTVADGVLRVWHGLGDREGATELAGLLLGFAVIAVALERVLRGRARHSQAGGRMVEPTVLRGAPAWAATAVCTLVVAVAFVLPAIRLGTWAAAGVAEGRARTPSGDFLDYAGTSLLLAAMATAACLVAAVLLARGRRRSGSGRGRHPVEVGATRLATLGYAVPGPVVGAGVLLVLGGLDRRLDVGLVLVGSLAGLAYAYVVRFLAVASQGVESGLAAIPPSVPEAARVLGAGPWQARWRVEVPMVRPALLAAAALVVVDVLKEQPATLLLRPLGRDTLSIWVWQATAESVWEEAAIPALALVAVGLLPVAVLLRASEARHR